MSAHPGKDSLREQVYRSTELCLRGEISADEMADLEQLLNSGDEPLNHFLQYIAQSAALEGWATTLADSQSNQASPLYQESSLVERKGVSHSGLLSVMTAIPKGWGALVGVLLIGFLLGVGTTYWLPSEPQPSINGSRAADMQGIRPIPDGTRYVARLVSNTGDVWNASVRQQLHKGDRVCKQETLTIQEGIAKLELVSGLTLVLEGPAMVSVDAEGVPVIQYGKVVAGVPWGAKSSAIKTSLGEVQLAEDDIAGIGVFGSSLSVYVYRGDVSIGARKNTEDEPLALSAGEGKTLSIGPSGGKRVVYLSHPTKKTFTSWKSIASDRLLVTDAYVASVLKSQPIAYWRFEEVVDGQVLNEVSDRHHGTLGGKARLVPQGNNHVLEFGFGPNSGHVFVEDPFDELAGTDYAIELWMNPNHLHRGIVVGLIERRTGIHQKEENALLLETLGQQVHESKHEYSLRFLHRSPPGTREGTSCYSWREYEPGKWQQLVAVKRGQKMLLYLNGSLVATGEDDSTLVPGLNLVIGQLYSFEPVRPFVGQIDELAVYNHALSTKEIKSRYAMLR